MTKVLVLFQVLECCQICRYSAFINVRSYQTTLAHPRTSSCSKQYTLVLTCCYIIRERERERESDHTDTSHHFRAKGFAYLGASSAKERSPRRAFPPPPAPPPAPPAPAVRERSPRRSMPPPPVPPPPAPPPPPPPAAWPMREGYGDFAFLIGGSGSQNPVP